MRRFLGGLWRLAPLATWRIRTQTWYRLRTPRERVMVTAAAVVLIGAGMFIGVWQPLSAMRAAALADISRYETMTVRLRAAGPDALDVTTRQVAPATLITSSAGDLGLAIRRLEPEGERIRVALEDAKFESVIVWLDTLESDHSLRVVSLELDRRTAPGVVSARVVLEN